uniref:Uncharacterized protein n=1 Tax=Sphenodon punctatus TaxID=8508 RepID=A0A8D0H5B3_SPHPU
QNNYNWASCDKTPSSLLSLKFDDPKLHHQLCPEVTKEPSTIARTKICSANYSFVAFLFCRAPGKDHELTLAPKLGLPLCQALVEFDGGNYDKAMELLYPLRYQLPQIGGSNAQRDVFNQLLIHAVLNSKSKANQKLAR